MRRILTTSISTLATPYFGDEDLGVQPVPDADSIVNAPEVESADTPIRSTAEHERVEGEKAPDFGDLFKKLDGKSGEDAKTKEAAEKKAAEEAAAAKEAGKKPEEGKKGKEGEQKTPKDDKGKKPEEKKKEEPPPKDDKKGKIPEDDKDLEKIRPRPDASDDEVRSFRALRDTIKETRAEFRALKTQHDAAQAELETLRKTASEMPPEVKAKIEKAEQFLAMQELDRNEGFKAQYDAPIAAAETDLFAVLKGFKASDDLIKEIKEAGVTGWKRWDELLAKIPGPLAQTKVVNALNAVEQKQGARSARLQELTTDRAKLGETLQADEVKSHQEFAKSANEHGVKLTAGKDFILEREEEPEASPEVQKAIAEHNASVKQHAEAWTKNVVAAYKRDPETIARMALEAIEAGVLRTQLEEMELHRERDKARITELEQRIAKSRKAGTVTHSDTVNKPEGKEGKNEDGKIGGDGAEAIASYFGSK